MIEVIEWAFSSGYAPETDPPDTPPPHNAHNYENWSHED